MTIITGLFYDNRKHQVYCMDNLPVNRQETANVRNPNSAADNVSKTHGEEESLEDQVANCIHGVFDSLPAKCKPRTSTDGMSEWIPLSGIATVRGNKSWLIPTIIPGRLITIY